MYYNIDNLHIGGNWFSVLTMYMYNEALLCKTLGTLH